MQVIECYDIKVWDGGNRHDHKMYVKTKEEAEKWKAAHKFDEAFPVQPLLDALTEWDAGTPRREALFNAIGKGEALYPEFHGDQLRAWQKAVADDTLKVQEAFYIVTKDRNSRGNCLLVTDIDFFKKVAGVK